jgi:hypothetical protein
MLATDDDCGPVEHRVVRLNLFIQSIQRVFVTLYLVADKTPVHERDVGSAPAVPQTEFVDHKHIRRGMVPAQNLPVEVLSYQRVIHESGDLDLRIGSVPVQSLIHLDQI